MDSFSAESSSSLSSDDGVVEIWHHILEMSLFLLLVLATFTVIILIARISRKKSLTGAISLRVRAERYLAYSRLGEILEISQALISVISVGFFIYGTYIPHYNAPLWYYSFELVFCVYFTLVWGLEYFLAKNKLRYIYSFSSIIDLITVLPIYDDLLRGIFFTRELYTFQFLRVLRAMRILRVIRILHIFSSEITRYFFKAFVTIFTFILVVAGFYMKIEKNTLANTDPLPPLQFHETVYFLVVTLTTVGYGDIHPTTAVGMITITLVICVGAILIPYQISVLTEKMGSYSRYNGDLSSSGITGHVICCGHIEYNSLLDFLLEFYHEKYGRLKKEVVILSATPPDKQLLVLLDHPFYKRRLKFLVGDVLVDKALTRTRYQKAEGCFIFRPKFWSIGDADTVLASLALKNSRKSMLVFPQVVTSHSRFRIPPNVKKYFCLEEFRSALLAQSIVCPGFSTLMSNLFTTRDPQPTTDPWLGEYTYGTVNSINRFSIPESLIGQTLASAILHVYETMSALIIGVEEYSEDHKHHRINLHPPPSTVLASGMAFIVISRSASAIAHFIPQSTTPAIPTYLMEADNEQMQTGLMASLYKKLFLPDSEDLLQHDPDAVVMGSLKSSFSFGERDPTLSPATGSTVFKYESHNVNPDRGWTDASLDVYDAPKLRRPDRLPSIPRVDSNSSDEMEILENSTSPPRPYYAVLRNICHTEFGGDWKAMLRGFVEALEKLDKDSPEAAFIVRSLKPLLFQPLQDDIQDKFVPKKGHIVVCGSLVGLEAFLKFFRLTNNTPIVILHPTLPPEGVWQLSQTLPFISFVKGTPFDRRDLEKCNIMQAHKIIVLSNPYDERESDAAVDADSLLTYFDMRNTTNATQILVEFINESNLRFLQKFATVAKKARTEIKPEKKEAFKKPNYYLTPEFAAGHVCSYSMVDSMMCQIYYKDYLNAVAQELIYGLNNLSSAITPNRLQHSHTFTIPHRQLYCYQMDIPPNFELNPYMFSVPLREVYCYHMDVPPKLVSHTYLELIRHFLQKDILAIGLFRARETTQSPLPYVFTCPPDNTILHALDRVIAFSLTPPPKY